MPAYVIVGHSERRAAYGETGAVVASKAAAAASAGLLAIVCVGETLQQREQGLTADVPGRQVGESLAGLDGARCVVAYEPVRAIGSGKVAKGTEISEAHRALKQAAAETVGGPPPRTLYGGSVNPGNAAEILTLENVDGVLVGGASLKAGDFLAICRAAG